MLSETGEYQPPSFQVEQPLHFERAIEHLLAAELPPSQTRAEAELLIQQKEQIGFAKAAYVLEQYGRGKGAYAIIDTTRFIKEFCDPDPMTSELHQVVAFTGILYDFKKILSSENLVVSALRTIQYARLANSRIEHILAVPSSNKLASWQEPNSVFELAGMVEGFTQHGVDLLSANGLDGEILWQSWQAITTFRANSATEKVIPESAKTIKFQVCQNLVNATLHGDPSAFQAARSGLTTLTQIFPARFDPIQIQLFTNR